jgi:hypothetical protein
VRIQNEYGFSIELSIRGLTGVTAVGPIESVQDAGALPSPAASGVGGVR